MGYTHYWTPKKWPTNKQWKAIEADIQLLFATKEAKSLIRYENDIDESPVMGDNLIRFNGIADEGHETFYFLRGDMTFQFCKTARKPYDLFVVACLTSIKNRAPNCYDVTSDGYQSEWEEGTQFLNKVTGETFENPIHDGK